MAIKADEILSNCSSSPSHVAPLHLHVMESPFALPAQFASISADAVVSGMEKMEKLLSSKERFVVTSSFPLLFERSRLPIVACGTSAVILELGECGGNGISCPIIGKLVGIADPPEDDRYIALNCYSVGAHSRAPTPTDYLMSTIECLREMGMGAHIPWHVQHKVSLLVGLSGFTVHRDYYYHLAPDLRQGGKYSVHELDSEKLHETRFGKEAQDFGRSLAAEIHRNVEDERYQMFGFSHWKLTDPEEALRKQLFVGVDNERNEAAYMAFGDLDHAFLSKCEMKDKEKTERSVA